MRAHASLLRRAARYCRRHGLWQAVRHIGAWCTAGSEDFIITCVHLAGEPAPDRVGDIVFRLATPADIALFDGIERYASRSSRLRAHVESGDWLVIALRGGRLVAARLITRDVPSRDLASRVLRLQQHQVWDDDMFCMPEYRGQGVARQLSVFSDRYMGSLGYAEAFARISTSNVPSLRMQRHKGSEFAFHVSYRRVLFYKRLRVSRQRPAGRPGTDVIASLPLWKQQGYRPD